MDYYPAFLNLEGRDVLVVGGGKVAARKVDMLLRSGAAVTLVAPEIDSALHKMAKLEQIAVVQRGYRDVDLLSRWLVIAATNCQETNVQVAKNAAAAGILINVVDRPELCNFIVPAVVDRSPLLVAISSAGTSPVLSRSVRNLLERTLPAAYGRLAEFLGSMRDLVATATLDDRRRRLLWEEVVEGPSAAAVLSGQEQRAEALFLRALERHSSASSEPPVGEVYLVGAGPGDPDLLTFKAHRVIQRADFVLYDRLVAPEIVDLARRDAEKIYVGKAASEHTLPQSEINELLLSLAQQGNCVVRLKGGDPFVFGRGGEEIDLLARERIPFQVIPGVTAASGCACYAGIPLTHRDCAQSVRFVTGHLKDGSLDLPWQELVAENQTVVFYMGLSGLETICDKLIAAGASPTLPAALIERGTLPEQRVLAASLASLPDLVKTAEVRAPTLIIVGQVVSLHESLRWFGTNSGNN